MAKVKMTAILIKIIYNGLFIAPSTHIFSMVYIKPL